MHALRCSCAENLTTFYLHLFILYTKLPIRNFYVESLLPLTLQLLLPRFFFMNNAPISFIDIHYFGTTFFYSPSSARHPHSSLLLAHHLPTRKKNKDIYQLGAPRKIYTRHVQSAQNLAQHLLIRKFTFGTVSVHNAYKVVASLENVQCQCARAM